MEDIEKRLTDLETIVLNEDGTNIAQALIALFQLVHQTLLLLADSEHDKAQAHGKLQFELSYLIEQALGKTDVEAEENDNVVPLWTPSD
jgi:hypothetical protein|tara:strand:+ start:659 stop:925 length:267 start_codon:yes stop_codon:yes gene_type:complete